MQPKTDEEHGKDQRAAAESKVAAHDAAAGAAPTAEAEPKPSQQTCSAEVGVVGMAVMSSSLARNMARHGYRVALFDLRDVPLQLSELARTLRASAARQLDLLGGSCLLLARAAITADDSGRGGLAAG